MLVNINVSIFVSAAISLGNLPSVYILFYSVLLLKSALRSLQSDDYLFTNDNHYTYEQTSRNSDFFDIRQIVQ